MQSVTLWVFLNGRIGFSFKNVLNVYLEMKLSKDFDLSISFKYQILSLFYETKGILKELDMIKSKFN